ncbi:hypothetical protein GWK47_030120 [Chionoecetes opilio]|uniref:Uncharacterized protein n=1 Tax=Chionoecetes opilio TaxID=41210 RepID=A0A8J5D1Q6_CHIOP|nr:hypothetical protein GWK47_030120 [Chionoecetes opilio]
MHKALNFHTPHLAAIKLPRPPPPLQSTRVAPHRQEQVTVPFSRTEHHLRSFLPRYGRLWNHSLQPLTPSSSTTFLLVQVAARNGRGKSGAMGHPQKKHQTGPKELPPNFPLNHCWENLESLITPAKVNTFLDAHLSSLQHLVFSRKGPAKPCVLLQSAFLDHSLDKE